MIDWYMSAPFHKGRKLGFPSWPPFLFKWIHILCFVLSINLVAPPPTEKWNMVYITKVDNLCDTPFHPLNLKDEKKKKKKGLGMGVDT